MAETWVVTGANRGIGLEFARQLVARGATVFATHRAGADIEALRATGAACAELDVRDDASVAAFAKALARPIDVLVNNAGRQYRVDTLDELDFAELADTFEVNAFGPLRVTRALLPQLLTGRLRRVLFLSSRMGSFGEFEPGRNMYGYRGSKAALNMFFRGMSDELGRKGITCVNLHPGWVRTDMGGAEARLSPEESVESMLAVATHAPHGVFITETGAELPW